MPQELVQANKHKAYDYLQEYGIHFEEPTSENDQAKRKVDSIDIRRFARKIDPQMTIVNTTAAKVRIFPNV